MLNEWNWQDETSGHRIINEFELEQIKRQIVEHKNQTHTKRQSEPQVNIIKNHQIIAIDNMMQCPHCSSKVRKDRLKKHLEKKCTGHFTQSSKMLSATKHSRKPKHNAPRTQRRSYAQPRHSDPSWYDCNSVDQMDGSKYLGYYRREYEGSRFGSFPLHDDYSEESWADSNPWE